MKENQPDKSYVLKRMEADLKANPPPKVNQKDLGLFNSVDLDLSRVDLIRNSSPEQLDDSNYLEGLISRLGLNKEIVNEQPGFVNEFGGGLYIWQYPNQFSEYLGWLRGMKIKSYMEIGCRWGGTFILTCEFLKKKCGLMRSTAMDIIDSPVKDYCLSEENSRFIRISSQSEIFKSYMSGEFIDMIMIDGHHGHMEVAEDYLTCRDNCNILVFHDIVSDVCPGVVAMWKLLKETCSEIYDFHEATDQYEEVMASTGKKFLGIGMAVRKKFITEPAN